MWCEVLSAKKLFLNILSDVLILVSESPSVQHLQPYFEIN